MPLIANVGLPPGAEVDRGVLEEIIGDSKIGWTLMKSRPITSHSTCGRAPPISSSASSFGRDSL